MSKNYKIVEREGKKIAYPENMDNKVIKILEEARVNRNFLNLIFGNKITGKAWDETFDTKGIIGLSKGSEYYFPILVSFSEDYDFLNEKTFEEISDFLSNKNLAIENVLSMGGGTISDNILAIRINLDDNDLVYVHKNFQPALDFEKNEIIEEKVTSNISEYSSIEGLTERKEEKINYVLMIDDQLYSRHETKEEAENFLKLKFENNLIDIKLREKEEISFDR